jgi:osmotically-inducible protein OsmY
MKIDSQLQKDVMAELEWEPRVDHANIGVAANNGIITLSGFVASYAAKLAAEEAARRVKGVRGLAEEIEVRFAGDVKTADPEIAKRIADMFDWSVTIPKGKINVKVEHGWVTLSGDVGFHFHRQSARDAASRIGGVKGVTNLIEVKKTPSPLDIHSSVPLTLMPARSRWWQMATRSNFPAKCIRVMNAGLPSALLGQHQASTGSKTIS